MQFVKKHRFAIALAALVLLMSIVGSMDYDDAKHSEEVYCKNVEAGTWPDYDGIYLEACRGGKPPPTRGQQ